ncbi:MAG: hypothetical protein HY064_04980 [Bacteroidetes bacterium]|nr:hypothetical protein [Bacteroidota bacterium]
MAETGKIKVIKDDMGSGGGITYTSGGGSTGSIGGGAIDLSQILVTVVSDRTGQEYIFNIPYYGSMNLNVGDSVKFEVLPQPMQKPDIPVYLERIQTGTIATINADGASGTITEKTSGKTVNFYQAHLAELRIAVGDSVRYTLVYTTKGEIAVNVGQN